MSESNKLTKNFIQRIIDEDNESEKTDDRLQAWSQVIIQEANAN